MVGSDFPEGKKLNKNEGTAWRGFPRSIICIYGEKVHTRRSCRRIQERLAKFRPRCLGGKKQWRNQGLTNINPILRRIKLTSLLKTCVSTL